MMKNKAILKLILLCFLTATQYTAYAYSFSATCSTGHTLYYNILSDSIQSRNDVFYWHTNPDIMEVSNRYGLYSAAFSTANGGGAMYQTYGNTSVPNGWLVPFPYIRIGRQLEADDRIAKVRLIVPHSEGTQKASSGVYPCFYEITFQRTRD
jgi:hypothetical protein